VARLATLTPGGRPHLVPVTFAVDGDVIYSAVDAKPKRTTRLARLRNIAAEPRVAMLADHYEADWHTAMAAPLALLAQRYPHYRAHPPGGPVIRVQVERWTGWAASAG